MLFTCEIKYFDRLSISLPVNFRSILSLIKFTNKLFPSNCPYLVVFWAFQHFLVRFALCISRVVGWLRSYVHPCSRILCSIKT